MTTPDPAGEAPRPVPPAAPRSSTPPPPAGSSATEEPDWTDQVADLVIDQVDKIRDRTTGTILQVARAVVYGIVALLVLLVVLFVTLVFVGRAIDLIPVSTWIPYTVIGLIGVIAGMVLWSKRVPS